MRNNTYIICDKYVKDIFLSLILYLYSIICAIVIYKNNNSVYNLQF